MDDIIGIVGGIKQVI